MRRGLVVLLAFLAFPAGAWAAPVLVLGHHGRVTMRNDPFVTGPAVTPAPGTATATAAVTANVSSGRPATATADVRRARPAAAKPQSKPVTLVSALAGLYHSHAIDGAEYHADVGAYDHALATEKHLHGTRATELEAVTSTMHAIAVAGQLTASRLPALFATLAVNQQWWTSGPLLATYQRVELAGSQLVWEYYPGQGIQLQILGSFSKADGLFTGGLSDYPAMEQLLSELIPLAVQRGGGLTWEYYFSFDGGSPPWTSAMSQATGLEALSRAYQATGNAYYLNVATQALPIFTVPPPVGVAVPTSLGVRFLQYTFSPQTAIINAFLQTLIGLYDFAHVSGNPTAAKLFAAGNAEAMAEVPRYDTGAWSLYQPGIEDDLSYHELVTGFLQQLCTRTSAPVYCTTAQHFSTYLKTPPALTQLTLRATAGKPFSLRFQLSKVSHVGIEITTGTRTILQTSADFPHGVQSFAVPAVKPAGTYEVRLSATDLAGNFAAVDGTLQVAAPPGKPAGSGGH